MKVEDVKRAFTLLELVLVLGIMSCLAVLLIPTATAVRKKAHSAACVGNLRQIGISAQAYASEHDQVTPVIEPWPSRPVYSSEDGAQSILDALKPYGLFEAALRCQADLAGPNHYAQEGSSYEWCPMANGQNVQSVKMVWAGNVSTVTLSQLMLAFDYSNVHNDASNVLFGDGHVAAAE